MEIKTKPDPTFETKRTGTQKITPFLWFYNQAEEAADFYVATFQNSGIKTVTRYNEQSAKASGIPKDTLMTVVFQIEGQEFVALNGGPEFEITPAISFFINCDTIQEIDLLWKKLMEGGSILMELAQYPFSKRFGWLKDKFGVTWQLNLESGTQKITPYLLFAGKQHGRAEEAINFYVSLFRHSGISQIEYFGREDGEMEGTVRHARFTLDSQELLAMDGGPAHAFGFTPGISLVVNCDTAEEIDHFWDNLTEGGDERAQQCGWLTDKYGVSWQVVPTALGTMLSDPDHKKSERVMQALIQMKKLDLNVLQKAYKQPD